MAEALYRKYRPQVFEDVVGQEAIERTRRFFRDDLHIPMTLREVGITTQDKFDIMAEKAAKGSVGSYVPLSKEDIIGIFKAAF